MKDTKKSRQPQLELRRQTIRSLTADKLRLALGGLHSTQACKTTSTGGVCE